MQTLDRPMKGQHQPSFHRGNIHNSIYLQLNNDVKGVHSRLLPNNGKEGNVASGSSLWKLPSVLENAHNWLDRGVSSDLTT